MIGATLILGASLVMAADADGGAPSTLVAKLGSGRFAEREAAARGLERLGAEAIPPLRAARDARDPEVRTRAAILLDRIEKRLLVRPTLVAIDADDRPLADVAREIGARTGMTPVLDADGNVGVGRRVTIHRESPIPYWSAIDLICAAGNLRATQGLGGQGGASILLYSPGENPAPPAPTSDSGPFRVKLVKLDYHRERLLEAPPGMPGPAETRHHFSAQLQVLAEPRLLVSQSGPVRVSEAIDDQGRSLWPAVRGLQADEIDMDGIEGGVGGPLSLTIPLRYPEPAGRAIRRLTGTIPVTVAARKSDPLVIPLSGAAGRTFLSPDASVTVVAVRSDPNEPQSTIELTIRPRGPEGTVGDLGARRLMPGGSEFFDKQVEVLDAIGRPFLHFPQDAGPVGEAFRVVLVLAPVDGAVKPATLRFYGLVRAPAEVNFDFADVGW